MTPLTNEHMPAHKQKQTSTHVRANGVPDTVSLEDEVGSLDLVEQLALKPREQEG